MPLLVAHDVGFLLINYEECRQKGAIVAAHDLANELKHYPYLLELDRRGSQHFAHYRHITEKFENFLLDNLPDWRLCRRTRTDITVICPAINRCGVNIVIGYYKEHTPDEYIKVNDAVLAYHAVCKLLQQPVQQPFEWLK